MVGAALGVAFSCGVTTTAFRTISSVLSMPGRMNPSDEALPESSM